ncbi:MAG: restriction endonuclease subunit S [Thermoanaerobaculia bacterium]|nr:restriction endonuclease subunit S [Thermoanaerobaculia bacterium]
MMELPTALDGRRSTPTLDRWVLTRLGDVIDVIRGVSYEKQDSRDAPADGLVPILRATNIGAGLDFDDLVYVPSANVSAEQRLRRGDSVIAASSGSRSVVGKAAMLAVPWHGSFGAFCFALRPRTVVEPGFLYLFLQTSTYRNRVSELAAGVNINNLRRNHIEETPFLLPPKEEQRRIVDEVEKQFTRLDAAVAGLQRVKANLRRYRASVLKAACEGRLVPTEAELARREGRSFESGEELLKRILKERRARWEADQIARMEAAGKVPPDSDWKARYREPEPVSTDKASKPQAWAVASLRQLAFIGSGNTPKGIEAAISASGPVPWFRVSDMNLPGNDHQMRGGTAFLTRESARALGLRLFGVGAVIFPKRGGAIATNKKRILVMPSATDLNIMAAEPVGCISPWLHLWFRQLKLGRLADGSNVPQINHGDVEPLPVPVPPLLEQERIVVEVERRLSLVDELEATVEKNLARCARLRQSILKMAFEGRLVPQDPNDEPASILLERIREERAQAKPQAHGVKAGSGARKRRRRSGL